MVHNDRPPEVNEIISVECGTNLYQVMLNCWKLEPDDRPQTNELIQFFEAYKDEMCPYQGKKFFNRDTMIYRL